MASRTDCPPASPDRGFVLGELFVAVFLLALAISSVTALMYSVTRQTRARTQVECTDKAGSPGCVAAAKTSATVKAPVKTVSAASLLVAGCAKRTGAHVQACNDSVSAAQRDDA